MIALTPPGARRQWRTKKAISIVGDLLDDGISLDELLEHVADCAELVRRGLERAHWYRIDNIFGDKTLERWRYEVGVMRERDATRAREDAAEAARADDHERAVAEPESTPNLQLHRWAAKARAVLEERWAFEQQEAERDDAARG